MTDQKNSMEKLPLVQHLIELRKSLLSLDADNDWIPVIKHHYQNCKDYGFTIRDLP